MRSVVFSQCRDRRMGVIIDVTGFGSFDNSTCKRVLDLLELGDLRLGQVVIESCSSRAWSEQWKWRWWKLF